MNYFWDSENVKISLRAFKKMILEVAKTVSEKIRASPRDKRTLVERESKERGKIEECMIQILWNT